MIGPAVSVILVFLISVGVGTTLYRMVVGPSILDRILGSDVLLSAFGAILCTLMLIRADTDQLILLLVISVTGFIGSVTVARFVYGQRSGNAGNTSGNAGGAPAASATNGSGSSSVENAAKVGSTEAGNAQARKTENAGSAENALEVRQGEAEASKVEAQRTGQSKADTAKGEERP